MLDEELSDLQKALENKIGNDYKESYKKIREEVDKVDWQYDDEDNLTNKKQLTDLEKAIGVILTALWIKNGVNIEETSKDTIGTTRLYFDFIDKQIDPRISTKLNLSKLISEQMIERNKKIQFNSVINGNAKVIRKKINKEVKKAVLNKQTTAQVKRNIKKSLSSNGGKAITIARTETNTHRSLAKQSAGKLSEDRGNLMKKEWVHGGSTEPRSSHLSIDGEVVYGINSLFSLGTIAPQQFGDPSEDINCSCFHVVTYTTPIDFDNDEYQEFIKDY